MMGRWIKRTVWMLGAATLLAMPGVAAGQAGAMEAALATYDRRDYAGALAQFQQLGQQGVAEAQYMAGLMHHRGRGVAANGAEAARWYAMAANQNYPPALTNLGILYRDGEGVAADSKQAADLLRRASYLEDAAGQLAYGAMMINEAQEEADFIEGVTFMQLAAAQGNQIARDNLQNLRLNEAQTEAVAAKKQEVQRNIEAIRQIRAQEQAQKQQGGTQPRVQAGAGADQPVQPQQQPAQPPAQHGGTAPFGIQAQPDDELPGWRITAVQPNSIAAAAQLRPGDVIIDAKDGQGNGINIAPEQGAQVFRQVLQRQKFTLVIVRQGNDPPLFEINIERPAPGNAPGPGMGGGAPPQEGWGQPPAQPQQVQGGQKPFGVQVQPHEQMPGWVITAIQPGSTAEAMRLRPGDVLIDAKDARGQGIPISPDRGPDALRQVLGMGQFTLVVMRPGNDPPIFEINVQRAGAGAAPPQQPGGWPPQPGGGPQGRSPAQPVPSHAASHHNAPHGAIVMKKVTLHDPGMNNMPSHTLLAPRDWSVEGGAKWLSPQAYMSMPSLDAKVIAPDGRMVHLMGSGMALDIRPAPGLSMPTPRMGQIEKGYPIVPYPRDPQQWTQFIQMIYSQGRPGAQNIRVANQRIEPTLTQILRRQAEPSVRLIQAMNQQNQAMGTNMQSEFDTAFLLWDVSYQQNGRPYEELLGMGVGFTRSVSNVGFGPHEEVFWWIEPAMAFRVPAGEPLERHMPLFLAIANSAQPTPQWAKMKADHAANMLKGQQKLAAQMLEESRKRSRIISETSEEIRRMNQESYEYRNRVADRSSREFSEYIRDVETYHKPDGEEIQLPSGYNHVYRNGLDEYILTNDHLYNPNTDQSVNNLEWERINPAP